VFRGWAWLVVRHNNSKCHQHAFAMCKCAQAILLICMTGGSVQRLCEYNSCNLPERTSKHWGGVLQGGSLSGVGGL
jgi:hypothetical protein